MRVPVRPDTFQCYDTKVTQACNPWHPRWLTQHSILTVPQHPVYMQTSGCLTNVARPIARRNTALSQAAAPPPPKPKHAPLWKHAGVPGVAV